MHQTTDLEQTCNFSIILKTLADLHLWKEAADHNVSVSVHFSGIINPYAKLQAHGDEFQRELT